MARKKHKPGTPSSTIANQQTSAVEITPYLYLGPRSATSASSATSLGITHIISLGTSPMQPCVPSITYHRLRIADTPSSDLKTVSLLAGEIINNARRRENEETEKAKAKVLVHCVAGVSRSPSVIAAYLVREEGMTLREALARLVEARPAVRPNGGFVRQLREIEGAVRGEGNVSLEVEELPARVGERRVVLGLDAAGTGR